MADLAYCYSCEEPLTDSASVEHVFQNSIGGRLKGRLLCQKCNTEMGSDADAELAECMNAFANFLNIRRDRGTPQPIEGVLEETGEKILRFPDGSARYKNPRIKIQKNGNQFSYDIRAYSRREVEKHLKNIKRKNPKLDLDAALAATKEETPVLNQTIRTSLDFGGRGLLRAVTKIATNFFLIVGGERSQIAHLLPYLREGRSAGPIWYFEPGSPLFDEYDHDIFHSILLVGSPEKRYLFAVVELFSVTRYVIELNASYTGRELSFRYAIDPVTGNEMDREVLRVPTVEDVKAALSPKNKFPNKALAERTTRFLKIAYARATTRKKLESIFDEAVRNNPPGDESVPAYFQRIWPAIESGILPIIQASNQAKRAEADRRSRRSTPDL
jgi:hypothetical protein